VAEVALVTTMVNLYHVALNELNPELGAFHTVQFVVVAKPE